MRPTIPRLIRILPRSSVVAEQAQAKIIEQAPRELLKPPSLYEVLLKRKNEAGASYPSNIRLEPPLTKDMFAEVKPWKVRPLKEMMKER